MMTNIYNELEKTKQRLDKAMKKLELTKNKLSKEEQSKYSLA